MRTKEELRDILATRLESKLLRDSSFSDLVSAVQGATSQQKTNLVLHLVNGRAKEGGELLIKALRFQAERNSIIEADALLADDALNLEELDSII